MKKNSIVIILTVVILASAGIWYIKNQDSKNSSLSSSPSPSLTLINQVIYTCNGDKKIDASFYKGETKSVKPGEQPIPSGMVRIVLSDGQGLDLPQTISADGGRYANSDESFIFWIKGDSAMVLENNVEKTYTGCVVSSQ